MKITNFDWNSFLVILDKKQKEDNSSYLVRVFDCLKKFHKKNTSINPPVDPFWHMLIDGNLELLLEERNFCDMYLAKFCDVKYKVYVDTFGKYPTGIYVYTHRQESKRPMIDFIKNLWKEFSYEA